MKKDKKLIPFTMSLYAQEFSDSDKVLPEMIHVAPLGKWDHPIYGTFEVTRDVVRAFVDNFNNGIRKPKLPITAGHDSFEEHKAIGWMIELQEGVNGLYAKVEWTDDGKDLLLKGSFKYFSPEWFTTYTDPADGKEYGHVLIGGALTNKPFFRELEDVVAFSEHFIYSTINNDMDLETLRAKDEADLTAEEKEFLASQEVTEETEEEVTEEATEEVTEAETTPEEEVTVEETPAPAHVASTVTMTAQQFNELAAQAEMGKKALQEVRTMTLAREVDQLVFSDTNKAGRFLPKDKSAVLTFMSTLEDKQRKAFNELIARIPAQSLFNEQGTGDDTVVADDPATELDAKVASLRSEDKSIDYRSAVTRVFKENPELAKKYEAKYGK
jgi:phage I-like protein